MTDQEKNESKLNFRPDQNSIDLCTKGLVEKFETPIQGIDVSKSKVVTSTTWSKSKAHFLSKAWLRASFGGRGRHIHSCDNNVNWELNFAIIIVKYYFRLLLK